MKLFKIIVLFIIVYIPLYSNEFEDYKLIETQKLEGDKVFDEMVRSIGNVENLKTIRTEGIVNQPVENGIISVPVQVDVDFSGKIRIKYEDKEFIIDEDKGWLKYPQGYYENLNENYIKTLSGNLTRNLIYIAQNKKDYEIKLMGEITILDKVCYKLELVEEGSTTILFVDIKDLMPVQMIYTYDFMQIIRTYLEYKVINEINYPIHITSTDINGNLISEVKILKIDFNIEIEGFK
ncbi:MAG: hypothetical protein P9L97_08190 [Candidatus Tenebribacter davisii]|nr:hypothetical protein [Candidatus Tenebribacter davisii]